MQSGLRLLGVVCDDANNKSVWNLLTVSAYCSTWDANKNICLLVSNPYTCTGYLVSEFTNVD
ncbi:hypothetical protein AAZX31_10G153300 [Glycine max]